MVSEWDALVSKWELRNEDWSEMESKDRSFVGGVEREEKW